MNSWRSWTLVAIGALAGFLYSNYLLDVIFSPDHDWFAVVSDLEVPGAPTATLLRTTDVLCGVLTLILVPFVRAALPPSKWRPWAVWLTVVFAVGCAVAGLVPLACPSGESCTSPSDDLQRLVHDGFSIVSQTAVLLGAAAVGLDTRRHGPRWLHRAAWATFWIGGVVGTILFAFFGALDSQSWQTGLAQRFQISVTSVWLVCLGVVAAQGIERRGSGASG